MPDSMPPWLWISGWTLVGLFVGSFLNVAIHRYPLEGESVSHPRRSKCPSCSTQLGWKENVPLLSWLIQKGRCRTCGWRIPLRYPLVEALTAGVWLLTVLVTPQEEPFLLAVRVLVLSGLVLATFVDLDCFEIPDSVSIGGMVAAPVLSFLVPELHAYSPVAAWFSEAGEGVTRVGALTASLLGLAVGAFILYAVGRLGDRLFGRESMGFGDVKLLSAGGGFVGAGGVVMTLVIGSFLASAIGILNMLRIFAGSLARARRIGIPRSVRRARIYARARGRYIPFGPYLAGGIGIALLWWKDVLELVLPAVPR